MSLQPSSSFDPDSRRWFLKLVGLLLLAALLANGVYLYYAYKVHQLDQQGRQLLEAVPVHAAAPAALPRR